MLDVCITSVGRSLLGTVCFIRGEREESGRVQLINFCDYIIFYCYRYGTEISVTELFHIDRFSTVQNIGIEPISDQM